MTFGPDNLLKSLDFKLSETFWKLDFWIGLATGGGTIWLINNKPAVLTEAMGLASTMVGVVVGAVVAGAAILAAFLDGAFLRKLKAIDVSPVKYFAPFLFTTLCGVITLLLMLMLTVLEPRGWIFGLTGALAGLGVGWTLGSLLFDLDVLVQFLRLQQVAADIEDPGAEGPTTAQVGRP